MKHQPSLQSYRRQGQAIAIGTPIGLAMLILTPGVSGEAIAAYVPPPGTSAPASGSTSTNTVRGGCTADFAGTLTPLAPKDHIGHTTSTQPTVAWFNPEPTAYPMEFRIVEYTSDQQFAPVYETEFLSTDYTSSKGIGQFDLSTTPITLSPGKSYRWQVVLVCNPIAPSESLMAEADLMVSPVTAATPVTTASLTERVVQYAGSGFWYEAMAEALSIDSAEAKAIQVDLLETLVSLDHSSRQPSAGDGDGSDQEDPETSIDTEESHGDRLQQVIDILSRP